MDGERPGCGHHEKRRRLALWPAGGFLWGGQSRILLFIAWNIKLPTLPRGTVRPPWILTTAGDGHTIPPPPSILLSLNVRGSSADLIARPSPSPQPSSIAEARGI